MRKIIHIDMDCFYAAIEMRDDPSLIGKPVAVGGDPGKRGVLSTCNYEARQYGLHSAMPTALALRKCPELILIRGNMAKYKKVSQQLHAILCRYTDRIQRIAFDEAYLDVTDSEKCHGSATWIAEEIRLCIYRELHLTASAGIAPNKLLAKIASNTNKPNGQYVVLPQEVSDLIKGMPVKKLMGVGAATYRKMQSLNIETCEDLQAFTCLELCDHFGKFGERLYHYCRGEDNSPVAEREMKKSISVEHTYTHDLRTADACVDEIPFLFERLLKRLKNIKQPIVKQYIKLKFDDFSRTSVEVCVNDLMESTYEPLMRKAFERSEKSVRLIGVGVRLGEDSNQLPLLEES